ncbi:MAG: 2-dehydropantoate 2-reductase [Betaproteobacteria bacterium]|nr:2-dehydropantoate 2-reductase [Betaproteobacteria bacterium]
MATGKVVVIGAGAVGLLYAGAMAHVHPGQVTLVTRRQSARQTLPPGVTLTWPDGPPSRVERLDVRLPQECPKVQADVALIAVAAYDSLEAGRIARSLLKPDGICITLQNGLDNQPAIAQSLGAARALQGATSFPVHLPAAGEVSINSRGATWLPPLDAAFGWLAPWLAEAGLNPSTIADPVALGWRKTAIATNGYLSLILASPMGRAMQSDAARRVAEKACLEILDVADASDAVLDRDDVLRALRAAWTNSSPAARSSLYNDYIAGRRTELDERLGAVIARGAARGVPVPTLELLYLLAKARLSLPAWGRKRRRGRSRNAAEEAARQGAGRIARNSPA